jgi:hypothetical protein
MVHGNLRNGGGGRRGGGDCERHHRADRAPRLLRRPGRADQVRRHSPCLWASREHHRIDPYTLFAVGRSSSRLMPPARLCGCVSSVPPRRFPSAIRRSCTRPTTWRATTPPAQSSFRSQVTSGSLCNIYTQMYSIAIQTQYMYCTFDVMLSRYPGVHNSTRVSARWRTEEYRLTCALCCCACVVCVLCACVVCLCCVLVLCVCCVLVLCVCCVCVVCVLCACVVCVLCACVVCVLCADIEPPVIDDATCVDANARCARHPPLWKLCMYPWITVAFWEQI